MLVWLLAAAGCTRSGDVLAPGIEPTGSTVRLARVDYGRLVDVYGLRTGTAGQIVELYRRDVIVGRDVSDQRVPGTTSENRADAEIDHDFIGADPDTLQPRLLIPREIESEAFAAVFDRLGDELSLVTPMRFGEARDGSTYTVVPRNAALRLRFTGDLPVTDEFFVVRGPDGRVAGVRNAEAVQLLQIGGDPETPGAFEPVPVRVVVGRDQLILDPVLLGSEGLQYATRNVATGLPASPDGFGANIRLALALDGPLAIPGLRSDARTGRNNAGRPSVIRDFRSGNSEDVGPDIVRGFVRDPDPPRLVGELPMYLERVEAVNQRTVQVTLWKGGVEHDIDRGDVVKFAIGNSATLFGVGEVVTDPTDDRGQPAVQRVRVRIQAVPGLEDIDPSRRPDFPADLGARGAWLEQHAPRAILATEFHGARFDPLSGAQLEPSDDPRWFGVFTPEPQPRRDGSASAPNENVSPFAGAVVRFSKPVDLRTVRWADSLFFATRNLTDQEAIDDFIAERPYRSSAAAAIARGMSAATFDENKFRTPHLIAARVIDEDGSQTTLRLQPVQGFYLDDHMRQDGMQAYYLHLLTGVDGIRDLSGNPLDLQTNDPNRARGLVLPFTLDPRLETNLSVSVVRRFASRDEDENPSYYLPEEVQGADVGPNAAALALDDLFGAIGRVDGEITGRPTTRLRAAVDDRNQAPVDQQGTIFQWCPQLVGSQAQVASNTATAPVGLGVQNPFNPSGCRIQMLWREIDLSLSRTDPFDFNLDVERVYWAPSVGAIIDFDEFDSVDLQFGHSEWRPEPCVNNGSALPSLPNSGLDPNFGDNYVRNRRADGSLDTRPSPHSAFTRSPTSMRIAAQDAVADPTGAYRYLALPELRRPYFVYRDETVVEQGCSSRSSADCRNGQDTYQPFLLSPWNNGLGRLTVAGTDGGAQFTNGFWNSGRNFMLRSRQSPDVATDGLVGNIALPLLFDFQVQCDSGDLPVGNGFVALGSTGWQTSVTLQSSGSPNFRVYSAGRPTWPVPGSTPLCVDPFASPVATGGFSPPVQLGGTGQATPPGDNTMYWVMIDFLKRASVATAGFIDLYNPHRVPPDFGDSRLGPYFTDPTSGDVTPPTGRSPRFLYEFEPPLSQMPAGTTVVPQFRAASAVDPEPWYWTEWVSRNSGGLYSNLDPAPPQPTSDNFPLDPFKAGDAHIRKFDDRAMAVSGGAARNWWSYFYNHTVTGYVLDPNDLMNAEFLRRSSGPNDAMTRDRVRYVNWRLLMSNNIEAEPPVAPRIDTFALAYRFERR